MGKNLEIVTSLFVLILAIGFSIWNFYNHSYTTAIIMLVIGVINIGYLIKEIIEKRRDDDGNN